MCFQQIGGFVREVMWDRIDRFRCRMLGWKAMSTDDSGLRFLHLGPMGSSEQGIVTGRPRHGYGQYYMGTEILYMTAELHKHEAVKTQAGGRLPDFLIIGAAKSGTSSIYNFLRRHPGLHCSDPGEPEFFSHDEVWEKGFDWYTDLFAEAGDEQICLEKSTAYTRWPEFPEAAPRIAKHLLHARFIYIIRHPVDRAYSHYVHRVSRELPEFAAVDNPPPTFEDHVPHDPICLNGSEYLDQIERYLAVRAGRRSAVGH